MKNEKILKEPETIKESKKEVKMAKGKSIKIDFITLLFFIISGFLFYNQNNAGWVFLLLGVIKLLLDGEAKQTQPKGLNITKSLIN